jgi:hypothetical protein
MSAPKLPHWRVFLHDLAGAVPDQTLGVYPAESAGEAEQIARNGHRGLLRKFQTQTWVVKAVLA